MSVRPPGNEFEYFYEDSKRRVPSRELEDAWQQLREKIKRIRPNIVVCLGAEPLRAVTNRFGIETNRGCLTRFSNIKVIATYHPASVMREYGQHPIVELDFERALRESKNPDYHEWIPRMVMRPTLAQTLEYLAEARKQPVVSFDIETIGTHVRCLGFGFGEQRSPQTICIPFIRFSSDPSGLIIKVSEGNTAASYWSEANEELVLQAINDLLCDEKVIKTGQNSIHFDQPILETEFGLHFVNHSMDIMHAWHLIYPELPKGLDFLVSVLTEYPAYWTEHDATQDESEWKYNSYDCAATISCYYEIEHMLSQQGLMHFYQSHIHPLAFASSRAAERGVKVDLDMRAKVQVELKIQSDSALCKLRTLAGPTFNPASPKQVKELLFDKLKYPETHKKGKTTTDEEALRKLALKYPNDAIFKLLLDFRKAEKVISGFCDVKLGADGRMRTSYNVSGTDFSRLASAKARNGEGGNLQNIPAGRRPGIPNVRHCFIAGAQDRKLLKADLSQAETMVVAWILTRYGDFTLYNKYQDPTFDIHRWMSTFIYHVSEEDVTKPMRDAGKVANHSGNYGAGPGVLVKQGLIRGVDDLTYDVAKRMTVARHIAIPGLIDWWHDVEAKVRKTRNLTTCFGRPHTFFGAFDDDTFRQAYSCEPQSTVGDVCNTIWCRIDEDKLEWNVLQVHDEVVMDCLATRVDEYASKIKEYAQIPLNLSPVVPPLIIPIDISVGDNWRDTKSVTV